MIGTAKQH